MLWLVMMMMLLLLLLLLPVLLSLRYIYGLVGCWQIWNWSEFETLPGLLVSFINMFAGVQLWIIDRLSRNWSAQTVKHRRRQLMFTCHSKRPSSPLSIPSFFLSTHPSISSFIYPCSFASLHLSRDLLFDVLNAAFLSEPKQKTAERKRNK